MLAFSAARLGSQCSRFPNTHSRWQSKFGNYKFFKPRKAASDGNPGLKQYDNGKAVAKTESRARTFVRGIENCGSISLLRIRTYITSKQSINSSLAIKEP